MKIIPVVGVLSLLFIISAKASEVVQFSLCNDSDEAICEIEEVRVDPCKEASKSKPCQFKRGKHITIEFDFIPHFNAEKLVGQAYSAGIIDLPLIGMDRDACKSTDCPTNDNSTVTYKNTIYMSQIFPLSAYTVKWRLWNPDQEEQGCCFTHKIKLVK